MTSPFLPSSASGALLALVALLAVPAPGATQVAPTTALPLSALVDSAGLARAAAALPAPEREMSVPPLFWVEFDSTGGLKRVEPVFTQLPADHAGQVAAAIRAHVKPQAPSREPVLTLLRVVAGPAPRVDRPALRVQSPKPLNMASVARAMGTVARRVDARPGLLHLSSSTVSVRLRAREDGTADSASAELLGSTGDAELDREAAAHAARLRFTPGTIEDLPAAIWVEIPVSFAFESEDVFMPVSEVLDSVVLIRELAGLSVPRLRHGMRPLFRVRVRGGAEGEAEVEPVYDEMPYAYTEPVAAALRASLKPQAHPWKGILRVVAGPRPAIERRWVPERLPEHINPEEIQQMLRMAAERFDARSARSGLPGPPEDPERERGRISIVSVRLRVLRNGRVDQGSIQLPRPTGDPELDRDAVRIAGQMRFRPASVYGRPAESWVQETLLFLHPPREKSLKSLSGDRRYRQ